MSEDNGEWKEVGRGKSSKARNRIQSSNSGDGNINSSALNMMSRIDPQFNLGSTYVNGIKKEDVVKKKGDIRLWIKNGIQFGDLMETILARLEKLKLQPCGKVDKLWNSIHVQLQNALKTKYRYSDAETMRNHIYDNLEGCYNNNHNSLNELSKMTKCHMRFFSTNERVKNIDYGVHESICVRFLHIGYQFFIPVDTATGEQYSFSEEDKIIIANIHPPVPKPKCNQYQVKNQEKLLEKLREMLIGMERAQELPEVIPKNGRKRIYYDLHPLEQLQKDKNLKLCQLDLKTAHSGNANIIHMTSDDKHHDIALMNRKNCGYNAFQGDKVYVKLNDRETYTGKVMGVAESNHKPINSLYICKVCKHQGSLMTPLDRSFPKIHVDNEPGRRRYETVDLKNKGPRTITHEQLSEEMRSREVTSYADNMYVSIFQMKVQRNRDKPDFVNPRVESFDPEMCPDLFIVCYEYWDISSMYPNGTVVGKLSTFDTFNDSLHLIIPICKVEPTVLNDLYKREIIAIKKKVKEIKYAPYDVVPKGAMVFTVDNEDTKDMDDALSYHVKDDLIIVGVHITDITKYISPQHEIYRQAQRRFMTNYPPKEEPIYLLDKELSTDLLSLLPNVPRAVLSVFFHFNKLEERKHTLNKVTFDHTVLISKYKLSYKYVENVIMADVIEDLNIEIEEDLFIAIKSCYEIARQVRRKRLPDSYFVHQANKDRPGFKFDDDFNAKFLIEEFMIMTNEHVARKIYEKYPNMSLLRVQDPVTDYDVWVENVFTNTNMNFPSSLKQCCNLLGVRRIAENKKDLIVSRKYYDDFKRYVLPDPERARNMLQYDGYINDFFVYLIEWYKINSPATYECSIANSVSNRHFSLNKDLYTHFTSPVRRFSDVIVHRLLKSALGINGELETLDENEVIAVCRIGNRKQKLRKNFEKLCAPYAIFEESPSSNSFIIDCICGNISNEEMHLIHPALERANSVKSLKFSHLSLDEPPVQLKLNEISDNCLLKWKKIIFSHEPMAMLSTDNKFNIDNHLHDARLPDSAHRLFNEIRRSYQSSEVLADKLIDLVLRFRLSDYDSRITSDSNSLADPIIEINLKLHVKNTIRMQFCSHKVNGLKRIAPELFIVYPTLQLCLIHQQDPVMCFVPGGKLELKHSDIIMRFDSIEQYKEYFTPLIYVESLMEILAEKSEFTLIDLPISWITGWSPNTKRTEIYGIIRLHDKFCTSKNIMFSDEREKVIDRYEYVISEGLESISGDLLCIRSKHEKRDTYWIGHGEVLNVCKVKDYENEDMIKIVFFILTQYNSDIFHGSRELEKWTYSVDVYLRSVVSKRQMEAVSATNTNTFMSQVILGDEIPASISENDHSMMDYILSELRKQRIQNPNFNQRSAIEKAMTKKLSLIWGPPGTGKTSIGCILAFAYTLRNEKEDNGGVVLYCGPSNDCVNLVAIEMQRKFVDNCPKLLRIFGEKQELADFPLPGCFNRNNKPLTGEMKRISLHFLIREMNDHISESLKKYDSDFERIRSNAHAFGKDGNVRSIIHEMIKMYKILVKEAKAKLLEKEKYNMILCTTSVSATKIMGRFKITQVIIDEAGMCKEPETLIPILSASETVENVVLIGDHKQLRPIIKSTLAGKRGLQISMFERYQSLRHDLVTMLNYQYRMHPSICEFPSTYFYSGKLQTSISNLWSGLQKDDIDNGPYKDWNGIDYRWAVHHYENILKQSNYNAIRNEEWPGRRRERYINFRPSFNIFPERLVFIHVVGDETIQSISTTAGNENSRANEVEVRTVGHIYDKLISRLLPPRLAPNFITVLTQYKLQEDKLSKKCKEVLVAKKIKLDPIVKTVIRSQGSENDYVIFSTVRSMRNKDDIIENPSPGWERQYLGFITDRNQVNVALTRAKKGLIIIGNKNLLSVNKMWKDLIDNLDRRGCLLNDGYDFLN